ncbi:MAG: ATP-binding protein [Candidatus Omnitrophota bacterium]|nr:ATP-binding protein [Candidatus Omnitrophota bacterium]
MKRYLADWKLLAGFGGLLFLIICIGLIGILQIQSLSRTVEDLGKRYFPIQKSALGMRVNNTLYAAAVRNYVFWRSSRYLEAARAAAKQEAIYTSQVAFDRHLTDYSSYTQDVEQQKWVEKIRTLETGLRQKGEQIVSLVNQLEQAQGPDKRTGLEASINKLLMSFENKLYRIDDFLSRSIEENNLEVVRQRLHSADLAKSRAIVLLSWSLLFSLFIGSQTAWLVYRSRRRERQRRQHLVRKMIRLEEAQRANLSLQVHDQMGQDLSGLKIYLDIIDQGLSLESEKAKKGISESKKILSGLIEKSHNIAELLRPPALEEIGLVDTIEALVVQYKQMTSLKIAYQKPQHPVKLSREHSLVLYRVAQEGLTNILKHSQAKNVNLKLEVKNTFIRLSLEDDGVGFDYQEFLNRPRRRKYDRLKLGLLGLKERLELLNGFLDIKTAPGRGTKLIVELPV